MSNGEVVQLIGITMAIALVVANLRGQRIGLSDGLRMTALWGFLIVTLTLVFSILGW